MKILVIGDIHGRTKWRQFINNISEYDKVVLMMDMFDSYGISLTNQLTNAQELIKFIADNNKIIALSSNHDWSYLDRTLYRCSGFNEKMAPEATKLMQENKGLFTHAVELDNILFTHAGVSQIWLNRYSSDKDLPIDLLINDAIERNPYSLHFETNMGRSFSGSGNDITQSPIWIRPEALITCMAYPVQVVGHTQVEKPELIEKYKHKLYLVDSPDYYSVFTDGVFTYHKFNHYSGS